MYLYILFWTWANVFRYACYRSVLKITIEYYRNRDETREINARRKLTGIVASMVSVEISDRA